MRVPPSTRDSGLRIIRSAERATGRDTRLHRVAPTFRSFPHPVICRTLRISCEAVPPSVSPAGAQGGTSACSTGAALSFVSCIRLLGCLVILQLLAHPNALQLHSCWQPMNRHMTPGVASLRIEGHCVQGC